jgi:GH24 family phage-related lysozyme (muramidase)
VAQWQAQMQRRGWTIAVDGLYGPQSDRIARQFQQEKGLDADGIVGAQTWQAAFDSSTLSTPRNPPSGLRTINPAGLNLIKDFEGLRLNSYRDAVGVWTIGYGHTRTAGPGQRITNEQAIALLRQDVATFEKAVTSAVRVPITNNQFAALVSFAYNVGSGALNSSTLLRRLNAGDSNGAVNEFLRWNRAGGQVLAGLTRRRVAERDLFLS